MTSRLMQYIYMVSAVLMLVACKADSEYSRSYPCHFIFFTQHHSESVLNGILDNPGVFAKVSVQKKSGVNHVIVEPNTGGKSEDISLAGSAIENTQMVYAMGANNALLIGCDTNMKPVAFDGQCANCLETYSTSNFPLAWSDKGRKVACAKCGRVYDLNASGICVEGERGRALYQYRAYMGTGYDGTPTINVAN